MENKTKATPGPWKTQGTAIWTNTPTIPYLVATVTESSSPSNGIDHLANAALIAAAPDMLIALEKLTFKLTELNSDNKLKGLGLDNLIRDAFDITEKAKGNRE